MTDYELFLTLLHENALIDLEKEYDKYNVRLTEDDCPDSEALIRHLPEDALVVKVDRFPAPNSIFRGDHGECCRCDYMIISESHKKIVFIELKKSNSSTLDHITKQLTGGECFLNYCQDIISKFWLCSNFFHGYSRRFVAIGHTSISKKKTRVRRTDGCHDSPERPLRIDQPRYIQFNQLAK